jgi:parvulin-like peptidyl-prolyl isomerase
MVVKDEEKDLDQVVATINGVEITKRDVYAAYHSYRYYYDLTDENETTEAYINNRNTLLEDCYNMIVEYEIIRQYAGDYTDVELTDEMKKLIEEDVEGVIGAIEAGSQTVIDGMAEKDPDMDKEFALAQRIEERKKYRGITTGEYEKTRVYERIVETVRGNIAADYEPTEKAIQNYYDTYQSIQRNYIIDNKAYYDQYAAESVNLYVPEGFYYVKNLLIAIPEEKRNEINSLRSEGKNEEADKLRNEELDKIRSRANEVYGRIVRGDSYEDMLDQYGEDPGMKPEGQYAKTGYRIYEGIRGYDEDFVNGTLALKNQGDISEPIESDFGFFILKLMEKTEAHDVPLEEVHDKIREVLIKTKSNEYYEEIYENWKRNAVIVENKEALFN